LEKKGGVMKKGVQSVFAIGLCVLFVVSISAEEKVIPTVVVLDSIATLYEPVTFDHVTHVMIAGGEGNCAECHHQHPAVEGLSCKDCHSIESVEYKKSVVHSFMSCSSCHGTYDISNPAMPGLKVAYHSTCFKCHRGMGNIGIDPKGCTEMCHARKSEKVSLHGSYTMPSGQGTHFKDEKGGV
jgi:hypothetical protein